MQRSQSWERTLVAKRPDAHNWPGFKHCAAQVLMPVQRKLDTDALGGETKQRGKRVILDMGVVLLLVLLNRNTLTYQELEYFQT